MSAIYDWIPTEPYLAAALVGMAVFLVLGWWREPRIKARIRAGGEDARLPVYNSVMLHLWALSGLVLALWLLSGRNLADIGLQAGPGGWPGWLAWGITAAGIAYLIFSLVSASLSRKSRIDLRRQIAESGDLDMIRPESAAEFRRFNWVAVTAGVTEEILFRGFLIAIFALFLPLWAAAIAALALFVLGHSYQGPAGMLRILPISIILTMTYVLSGSLWPGIILHAFVDLAGGGLFQITAKFDAADREAEPAEA
ncbi:CPBP family intramembrane glutamic endopeptidase [Maricaulis sp.]|uniref:CPBP family intramembrane glutamic endopeptidase n=1 Tax=Maricaulis sp. TaxID=1486257 RepID=UPI00262693D1|nr:CPBP family intramembrane glutamic endopeptidase [Maricaulis sp.]